MTVELLKKICKTQTEDTQELLRLSDELFTNKDITPSVYATLRANINMKNPSKQIKATSQNSKDRYTEDEILTVTQSHLDVYDGIKTIQAHLNLMKQMFGESSSQYRNGAQYNKRFYSTLDLGHPNLGQSMPSNWAEAILTLIQNRDVQFQNTLKACREIYESTNNGNMYKVIQKWSIL